MNIKDCAKLDIEFFEGYTKDGRYKTIAKCVVEQYNIPFDIRWRFFNNFESKTLSATAVCSKSDMPNVDPELGRRIARKKLLIKYFDFLRSLVLSYIDYLDNQKIECVTAVKDLTQIIVRSNDKYKEMCDSHE